MTNMLDYVISNEREKSLKNIANVSTAKKRSLTYVRDDRKPQTPALSFRQSVATRNLKEAQLKRDPSHTFRNNKKREHQHCHSDRA